MGQKKFNLKVNSEIEKCPKCGNNTSFVAHSEQVCEDGCEVWIVCKCGFDPTSEKCGHRLEDVMGSLDRPTILDALQIWNEEVLESQPLTPQPPLQ